MPIVTVKPKYSGGSCALVENGRMCGKPIKTRGKCSMHWARVQRHGSPFAVKNMRGLTPLERFEKSTAPVVDGLLAGCSQWTMALDPYGYGRFAPVGTRTVLAHRWIYEQKVGPIPEGMTLDHVCHNEAAERGECNAGNDCLHRRCTELEHLVVKTAADNAMASANHYANKTHCKRGHEFTPENTYDIKTGGRACRTCHRDTQRERARRLAAERKAAD